MIQSRMEDVHGLYANTTSLYIRVLRDLSIFGFWYPWASWTIPQEYQETTIPLKLLHIINHQRNANQNHKEIAPEIC